MSSTFTKYANLEKFEDRSIGWDFGDNLDSVDQAINMSVQAATQDIDAFEVVGWDSSADSSVKLAQLINSGVPAAGIALSDIANGATGQILHRGLVENPAWSWNRGTLIYLSTTAGGLAEFGTTHVAEGQNDSQLMIQCVGYAVEADRVFFDFNAFRPNRSYCILPDAWTVTSGAATLSWKSISGPGNAMVLSGTTATIVFTYTLPGWFHSFPAISGVWAWKANYIATASGQIDVTLVHDGVGNSGDPGISAGTSTSWAALTVDMDDIAGVSGLTPTAGKQFSVTVTLSTANVDVEVQPRLRFCPDPTILV